MNEKIMYGDIFHFCFLSATLIQNYLARTNVIDSDTHFKTLLCYTTIDCFFLINNPRRYSIFIHHLHTSYLLYGALQLHPSINCYDLVILELTTVFNCLNRLIHTKVTLQLRNLTWISIRLILLPIMTVNTTIQLLNYNYDMFLRYSYSYLTILILSLEWTRELLKIQDKNLTRILLIVPLIDSIYKKQSILRFIDIFVSGNLLNSLVVNKFKRYENKLLGNTILSYLLTLT